MYGAEQPNPVLVPDPPLPHDWFYMLIDSALPGTFDNMGRMLALHVLDDHAQNSLLETALALHAYKLDHDTYPRSLDALVPAYVPHVPDDPFSSGGRDSLRYRQLGDRYVLYSVGPDGVDDGGKPIYATKWSDGSPLVGEARYYPALDSKGDIVASVNF